VGVHVHQSVSRLPLHGCAGLGLLRHGFIVSTSAWDHGRVTSQDSLTERYGVRAPWRRRVLVGACAVVVATFGAWLAWTVAGHASPDVASELVAFEIVDDYTVDAALDIEFDDGEVEATCLLRAFAEDHTVVGELSFTPDPGAGPRFEESVRTERRATSVESLGCTAPGQPRPR
jgi:hypothetical protein